MALILRDLFARLRLECSVKTSGQKGLHVYVPLNRPATTFDDTKTFSRAVAVTLQRTYPELVTAKMAKTERRGKIFINWSQNERTKTMVCVYSLRAREEPFVSFPLSWPELERRAEAGDREGLQVRPAEAVRRLKETGDLFREALSKIQELPHL